MDWIDLRSDTVSHPTPAMRRAMAEAEVGDDVFGDDPTVARLEAMSAQRLGKQSALFMPSGTMGNLAAVLAHCRRGDEILLGDQSHTFLFEAGGVSALGGVHTRTVPNQPDGTLLMSDLEAGVRSDDEHYPVSRLVLLENTHNRCGGAALDARYTKSVAGFAERSGMALHLDGARIFNAEAVLGTPAAELAEPAASVTFCLSKGLCAPAGSVLCGEEGFIRQARRLRKQLGGGMRQVGILAAAGIVALQEMTSRLSEDHRNAQRLADGLRDLPGVTLTNDPPPTNMLYLEFASGARHNALELVEAALQEGIKLSARDARYMRLVTHYWVDSAAIEKAVSFFRRSLRG